MSSLNSAGWLIIVFACLFGGSVGSFLNVVVYRLPLGLSLIWPPSHCPKCKKRIAWYDNVPVFGWLMLGGKCRNCHLPIAIRYPLVEAVTALMFGLVVAVQCMAYPVQCPEDFFFFALSSILYLILLSTLLCSGLIEFDGIRPPATLFIPSLVIGLAACLMMGPPKDVSTIINTCFNLGAGILFCETARRWRSLRQPNGLPLGFLCVGLILGWQAICACAVVTILLDVSFWFASPAWMRLRPPPSMVLWILAIVWILVRSSLALF